MKATGKFITGISFFLAISTSYAKDAYRLVNLEGNKVRCERFTEFENGKVVPTGEKADLALCRIDPDPIFQKTGSSCFESYLYRGQEGENVVLKFREVAASNCPKS